MIIAVGLWTLDCGVRAPGSSLSGSGFWALFLYLVLSPSLFLPLPFSLSLPNISPLHMGPAQKGPLNKK